MAQFTDTAHWCNTKSDAVFVSYSFTRTGREKNVQHITSSHVFGGQNPKKYEYPVKSICGISPLALPYVRYGSLVTRATLKLS